jgi:hypothetical protein
VTRFARHLRFARDKRLSGVAKRIIPSDDPAHGTAAAHYLHELLLTSRITFVSCTEAVPYTLTPIERPEDLRWHRIAPSPALASWQPRRSAGVARACGGRLRMSTARHQVIAPA